MIPLRKEFCLLKKIPSAEFPEQQDDGEHCQGMHPFKEEPDVRVPADDPGHLGQHRPAGMDSSLQQLCEEVVGKTAELPPSSRP